MNEREDAGMRRLMRDLDEADWPAPELLARYATEPNRLSEDEKRRVEGALAASSIVADELATLRGFDFSRLDADRVGAAGTAASTRASIARLLPRWLERPTAWVALAAGALALAYGLSRLDRDEMPTTSPAPAPQLAEAPETAAPREDASPPAPAIDQAPQIARQEPDSRSAPERATGDGPALPSQDEPAVEIAQAPSPTPAPQDEVDGKPGERAAPVDESGAAPSGEILLAMAMPDYRPAYGVEVATAGEWIVRGTDPDAPRVTLLAPEHVVRSCTSTPVLHWSIDRLPPTGTFFLTIVDANDEPIELDRALARPARAGLQRVDLGALGIRLPAGRDLRWSIALREDDEAPPRAFDLGWLRAEAPAAGQAAALAARGDETRAAGYAELGCYAEALEAALRLRADHPELADADRAIARLAEGAGFDPALARE